jgi:uncharacterized protein YjbI with pentapeptide repeats
LSDADLTDADLTGAIVEGTNFNGVIWTRATINGVDLTKANCVDPEKVKEAQRDSATKLPSNTKPCDS